MWINGDNSTDVQCDLPAIPRLNEAVSFDVHLQEYRNDQFYVDSVTHFPLGGPHGAGPYVLLTLEKINPS